MKSFILAVLAMSHVSFAKETPRKPSAFSIDATQFQEMFGGKLKGQWIELATSSDQGTTSLRHTEEGTEYMQSLVVRMNYLKILKSCESVVSADATKVLCKLK